MSKVFGSLEQAAFQARDSVAGLSATTSRAQTQTGVTVGAEAAASDLARAGLFQEAILTAMRAHVTEYKTVTQK